MSTWEIVIGLEVHVQLNTASKIFSGANTHFGATPNSQACIIDLGMPGTLPVLNKEAVKKAILFGLAIDAEIAPYSIFARKNYFYPDLPKGYQISQLDHPIVGKGKMNIQLSDGTKKTINVTRAHLEEDAGKSLHEQRSGFTGVDLNRAGTPLLEIVSEPELRSGEEAVAYLKALHSIITCLEISDGNMAEGSMRCDANVSVRKLGSEKLGTRTEIKNVNSFRFVEKAIAYEAERQIDILESGGSIRQETRLYNSDTNTTHSMRSKEEANDYRYFPDPDLLPIMISEEWKAELKASLPELPRKKCQRFQNEYGLSEYEAQILTSDMQLAHYFEAVNTASNNQPKLAANWIIGNLLGALNKNELTLQDCPIAADSLGQMIARIADNTLSNNTAKIVFEALWKNTGKTVDQIISEQGLQQITDVSALTEIIQTMITNNPNQVTQYREADEAKRSKLIGFFVGQVMKATQGKAPAQTVNELLGKYLLR